MNKLNEGFFNTNRIRNVLTQTTNRIENANRSTAKITSIYDNLTDERHQEMDEALDLINVANKNVN